GCRTCCLHLRRVRHYCISTDGGASEFPEANVATDNGAIRQTRGDGFSPACRTCRVVMHRIVRSRLPWPLSQPKKQTNQQQRKPTTASQRSRYCSDCIPPVSRIAERSFRKVFRNPYRCIQKSA